VEANHDEELAIPVRAISLPRHIRDLARDHTRGSYLHGTIGSKGRFVPRRPDTSSFSVTPKRQSWRFPIMSTRTGSARFKVVLAGALYTRYAAAQSESSLGQAV